MSNVYKLLNLRQYHRPADEGATGGLERALELLSRPGLRTVPLAGGDSLVGSGDPSIESVVDLQGLGLDTITTDAGAATLRVGAMVTRAELAVMPEGEVPSPLRILADGARRWGGGIQRNRATVGGAIATAAANDPLVATLLACDARVVLFSRSGRRILPLADFLPARGDLLGEPALITEVTVPLPLGPTGYGLAEVARTPSDAPIVLAAAALSRADGRCTAARLALGGIADTPVRLPEVEAMLAGQTLTDALISAAAALAADLVNPAGDYRGSAVYRKAMADVLAERALRQAWDASRNE